MGTTAQKLNKVLQTKNAIKEALIEKGVEVSASDTFASYPEKILEIQTGGNIYDGPFEIVPTVVDPTIQDPVQWDVFEAPFIEDEEEFEGLSLVKVRKIGAWIDSNISADNIRQGHTILGVRGNVVELLPEERTVTSSQSTQVITPSTGRNGITKITINPYVLQTATVNPTFTTKTYYPASGYNGFSQFSVNAIDVQTIVDEEPKLVPENIKKNVSLFGGQIVGTVAPVVDILNVTPTTSAQTIHVPQGIDGYNIVNVEAVTSAIDPNIIAKNIKRDVEILGVIGTYTVENLQDKVVDPQPYIQNITFDSTLGYEGLRIVTINPVTSSVDANIKASNIKKDVQILNVIGTYEGEPISFQEKTVEPTTLSQIITPDAGYDGLSKVNIGAVTASIDPNILAENIKKNISILGVTGTYEDLPNYQESKTVQPVTSGDIEVTPDPTYDALLKVIVKAVTASIDPNILPKNIRKNISILGVLGTMEEGGEQKWFDFSGIQNFVELNQDAFSEGGNESIKITASDTNYQLAQMINETFPSIENINAVMLTQVYGYDDEEITDDIVEDCYINFIGGSLYQDFAHITNIPDQIRYFYPYVNDYNVNGLTFGLGKDDGQARVMKLYVITDSYQNYEPTPILVNGVMDAGYLPEGYDRFRFVKDIQIPAHNVFIPKMENPETIHWVLRDEDTIATRILETESQPDIVQASAYDLDYGKEDVETTVIARYELDNFNKVKLDQKTLIASQSIYGQTGTLTIPGTVEKQSGYYYYFKVKPQVMDGYKTYYPLVSCDGLFKIYLYRYYNYYNYYLLGWQYNWNSATSENLTYYDYYLYAGGTYYIRVYVNGTTARLDFSSDGVNWTNNINTVSSGYINPTNANPIYIYANSGPNTQLCADGIYITDGTNKVYSVLKEIEGKQTSHEIVPLAKNKLLVNKNSSRISIKYQGDEISLFDSCSASTKLLDMGTSGYIELQNGFNITGKTWEICQHFRLPSITSSSNRHLATWFALESSGRRSCFWINTGNRICARIYYDSGSTIVDGTLSNNTLTVGTNYYIKYGWDGYRYYMIVSASSTFNSSVASWTSDTTTAPYAEGSKLILGNWEKAYQNGSIRYLYLDNYTQVRVGNKVIWKPQTDGLEGNLVNYTDDGSPVTLDAYLAKNSNNTVLNASIVGVPTISDSGIASNLNMGNYIWYDKDSFSTANNFEIYTQFMFTSTYSDWRIVIGSYREWGWNLAISSESKLHWNVGNGVGTWSNGITGTETLLPNVWYNVKIVKSGNTSTLYHSTETGEWVTDGSVTYSGSTTSYMTFGTKGSSYGCSNVYINLNNTYIKVNNEIFWKPEVSGVSEVSNNSELYKCPIVASRVVPIDKFNKQYINSRIAFKPENNTWEICTLGKLNNLFGCLFGNGYYGEEATRRLCVFSESDGTIWLGLSSDGESWDICDQIFTDNTLSLNTWYWFKLSFDGTGYKFQVSTDNTTWTDFASITSSTPIFDIEDNIIFGTNPFSSAASTNIDGNINLSETYIKINNEIVWEPTFRTINTYDWIFTQDENWSYTGLTNLGKKGELVVPEHNIYQWNQTKMKWEGLKQLTFNLDDPDAILYTKLIEN